MKKASVNYWVDLATGIAFLLCAVTGVAFLFPSAVHTAAGTAPTILFTPALWWHKVHDWSGVVIVAGTALHLALHAKWIATMTRRTFGAKAGTAAARTAPAGAGRPGPATRPSPVTTATTAGAADAPAAAAGAQPVATCATPQAAEAAAAASLRRLEDLRAERQREREQRISRRRFLAGAGAVGGLALLAGVGLVGRDAISQAASTSGTAASSSGASGGSGTTTSSSQSTSSSSSACVVVDESACVSCGHCLQTCPKGVFGWSSAGRASAQDPDACIRCGRCLQVCPAGAITINA